MWIYVCITLPISYSIKLPSKYTQFKVNLIKTPYITAENDDGNNNTYNMYTSRQPNIPNFCVYPSFS